MKFMRPEHGKNKNISGVHTSGVLVLGFSSLVPAPPGPYAKHTVIDAIRITTELTDAWLSGAVACASGPFMVVRCVMLGVGKQTIALQ